MSKIFIFLMVSFIFSLVFVSAQTSKGAFLQENSDELLANSIVADVLATNQTDADSITQPYPSREVQKKRHSSNTGTVITNTSTQTTVTGSSGSGRKNDDESNGRRLQPISLPLEELSTENQSSDDEDSGFISSITGAVIGAVGKRGATGLIILIVVLAVVGVVVYNRRKIGIVKASN